MRRHTSALIFFASLSAVAMHASAHAQSPRQVAAPAEDIRSGRLRLPDPAQAASNCKAAIVPLVFERSVDGRLLANAQHSLERSGTLTLVLVSPSAASWRVLAAPSGELPRPIEALFGTERSIGMAGEWLPGWVAQRLELQGVGAGAWTFQVDAGTSRSVDPGWLFASSGAHLFAGAWVNTQQLVAGDPIAVVAHVEGRELLLGESARLTLETETEVRELDMHDDGAHGDGEAGDGRFGAFVPAELLGQVRARVDLYGTARNGGNFARSALLSFPVLAPQLRLDGTAQARLLDDARLKIALGALPQNSVARLHVSAEVWGRDADGNPAPVCWLSKMLLPEAAADRWRLPLSLDLDWLDVEGIRPPLELRAVRVQDPDTQVVFDRLERIEFATPALNRPRAVGGAITAKMLTGASDTTIGSLGAAPPEHPHYRSLVLVHGYCSSGSIWPAADFSQPKLEFLDPNANRSHDQFAQLIAQRAAAQRLGSFGVVAHSQGGPASLHLLTYYNSALDRSGAGRRIQSVASPYQGTPLASLGGFACGVNSDMTPAGSATWLAGIPTWARAEVSTWTTANSGSACNALTSLFLTDPEDGTVEKFRSELPGGNNLGHVPGWCHTTGMSNPANYTDHARNLLMDAAAGR